MGTKKRFKENMNHEAWMYYGKMAAMAHKFTVYSILRIVQPSYHRCPRIKRRAPRCRSMALIPKKIADLYLFEIRGANIQGRSRKMSRNSDF
mmetsp:Transcript_49719/g.130780  ORF Transcript_49719/g.130780 Transcript_49719/m.130780 type:complete len:92 (+) Transcript_49719:239-514(+)